MKNITTLGIDLAKNVFQLHGTDSKGNCVLRRRITRGKLSAFIVTLKPPLYLNLSHARVGLVVDKDLYMPEVAMDLARYGTDILSSAYGYWKLYSF